MKMKATCLRCGHNVETDIEVEVEASRFSKALGFLTEQTQEHHHPEVHDSVKWRLGWEERATQ